MGWNVAGDGELPVLELFKERMTDHLPECLGTQSQPPQII